MPITCKLPFRGYGEIGTHVITKEKPAFDLCGGHPALDFINSLDHRFGKRETADLISSYQDLLRFGEQTRLLEPRLTRELARSVDSVAAARALHAAKNLREALAVIFYGYVDHKEPPLDDIRILERTFINSQRRKELRWTKAGKDGHSGLKWGWGRFEKAAELPIWVLSQQAMQLLTSDTMQRVRTCEALTCRWLFVDTSKNGTRRWCKMEVCGNRMKAQRFQARHSQQP